MGKNIGRLVSLVFWGTIAIFGLCYLLFFLVVVLSPFVLSAPPSSKVEWHMGNYYLQYETDVGGKTGHHLLYKIDGEKVEILPHVYGYKSEGDYVYFASVQGYAVINQEDESIDIVLLAKNIPKVEAIPIQYYWSFDMFSVERQEILLSLSHKLLAYRVSWGKDGEYFPIADGRFQYSKFHYTDGWTFSLWGYGLGGNYDVRDELLPRLNGYKVENGAIFYATSPQGYAIVDGPSGTCRIYFTDSSLAEKDYQQDIYVLDSFEDFTPEEQEILCKVEQEGL